MTDFPRFPGPQCASSFWNAASGSGPGNAIKSSTSNSAQRVSTSSPRDISLLSSWLSLSLKVFSLLQSRKRRRRRSDSRCARWYKTLSFSHQCMLLSICQLKVSAQWAQQVFAGREHLSIHLLLLASSTTTTTTTHK